MRYAYLCLGLAMCQTWAASVNTPFDPVPDLTRQQVRQAQQNTDKTAASPKNSGISMTSEELLQQPELLNNVLDSAMSEGNIDNVRFLLPIYRRLPEQQQDMLLVKFAQALLDRADGKHTLAAQKLREILAEHPEYAPIRLQLAYTLSQDEQKKEAAQEVAQLQQTAGLPAPIQYQLSQFEQHLKRERGWSIDGNAYYLNEKNIANAPPIRRYGNWHFEAPRQAHGIGYELSARKTIPIQAHWATRVNLSVNGKYYWDAKEFNEILARADAGLVWRDANQEIALLPYFEQRWLNKKNHQHNIGAVLNYTQQLSPRWQLFGAWQSGYKYYDERPHLEGMSHLGSLSLMYRPVATQQFVVGTSFGRENAKDPSDAYQHIALRLGWNKQWLGLNRLNTSISANIQKRHHRAEDLFNIKRQDTKLFTRLSVSHPKLAWKGFMPRLHWTWSHTRSNHFYYRNQEHQVFVDVVKQF